MRDRSSSTNIQSEINQLKSPPTNSNSKTFTKSILKSKNNLSTDESSKIVSDEKTSETSQKRNDSGKNQTSILNKITSKAAKEKNLDNSPIHKTPGEDKVETPSKVFIELTESNISYIVFFFFLYT